METLFTEIWWPRNIYGNLCSAKALRFTLTNQEERFPTELFCQTKADRVGQMGRFRPKETSKKQMNVAAFQHSRESIRPLCQSKVLFLVRGRPLAHPQPGGAVSTRFSEQACRRAFPTGDDWPQKHNTCLGQRKCSIEILRKKKKVWELGGPRSHRPRVPPGSQPHQLQGDGASQRIQMRERGWFMGSENTRWRWTS